MKPKIYAQEVVDGLAELIQSKSSIAFETDIINIDAIENKEGFKRAIASIDQNNKDYNVVWSILVSSNINKNDDVFSKEELWKAKDTPINKPSNIDHNENEIVGHITGSYPVDNDYNFIPLDTPVQELPELYHLLVSSIVYGQWGKSENKERSEKLMDEINNGERKVSMECVFNNFDYAVESPDGKMHIVQRDDQTAFLSKYLRAYGGTGEYQKHKVFRYLKDYSFSGKGFVLKPANPYSIILNNSPANLGASEYDDSFKQMLVASVNDVYFSESGVDVNENLNNNGDNIMSIEELQNNISELETQLSTAKVSIGEYESQVETLKASIEEKDIAISSLKEDLEACRANCASQAQELTEQYNSVKAELDKHVEAAKKMYRMGKMKQKYMMAEEQLEEKYNALSSLTDEQFDAVMALIPEAKTEETIAKVEVEPETIVASEIVEPQVIEDISLPAEETDSIAPVRESLRAWAEKIVNKK